MASASAKVGCLLRYQAACLKAPAACAIRPWANTVTSENKPISAGVVRRIAISDHCLCVSNPRCLRTSWKVTSNCPAHHEPGEDLPRIGLEVSTQEGLGCEPSFGIADQHPAHGHGGQTRGVPHGRLRSDLDHALPTPIPVGDLGRLPNGSRSSATTERLGKRSPFMRGLPIWPWRRGGAGS